MLSMPDLRANHRQSERVWMVWREGYSGPVTFGPFATRQEAEAFTQTRGGYVYDAIENQKSNCGPWLP